MFCNTNMLTHPENNKEKVTKMNNCSWIDRFNGTFSWEAFFYQEWGEGIYLFFQLVSDVSWLDFVYGHKSKISIFSAPWRTFFNVVGLWQGLFFQSSS